MLVATYLLSMPAPAFSISNDFIDVRTATITAGIGNIALMKVKGRFVEGTKSGTKMMYGFPSNPWSSYTTIKIEAPGNTLAIYGGGGTWITNPVDGFDASNNTKNTSAWQLSGIKVTQDLTIVNNPRTGSNPDTLEIKYTVENTNTFAARAGVRTMIDTQLGGNDNSPIIAQGIGRIIQEQSWTGAAVPEAWYTLDNYFTPSIKAEGGMKTGSATAPDMFLIGDWGYMKEDMFRWDYTLHPEDITDTAVAVFWGPYDFAAGETRSFKTYYGLQEVSGAELAITKSADLATANYGDTLSYVLTYSNLYDAALTGLSVWDTLPWNTTFVDASTGYTLSGGVISWTGLPDISNHTDYYSQWFTVSINEYYGVKVTNSASAMYTDAYWADKEVRYSNTTTSLIATLTPSSTPTVTVTFTNTQTHTITPTSTITPTYTATPPVLELELKGAFPNPAESEARIVFKLSRDAGISINVYTVSGEKVRELKMDGLKGMNAGLWDGKNNKEKPVSSGTYIYILEADAGSGGKKKAEGKLSLIK